MKLLAPTPKGMLSISRAVELNPLGPVQLQDPPVTGWGPRLTVAGSEATVTPAAWFQVAPLTWT